MKLPRLPVLSIEMYSLGAIYTVALILLHWPLILHWEMGLFAIGALIGLHLFDVSEAFITSGQTPQLSTNLFRSVLTQLLITGLTLFVLTSTDSIVGRGLVLLLNLRLFYLQFEAYRQGKLALWFRDLRTIKNTSRETWYIRMLVVIFILETILFMLV